MLGLNGYYTLVELFLQRIDQHAAGGKDVFATAAANGRGDTMRGEVVA